MVNTFEFVVLWRVKITNFKALLVRTDVTLHFLKKKKKKRMVYFIITMRHYNNVWYRSLLLF